MTEEYTVPEKDEGERIDRFLAASGEYSRSFLQKLLKAEKVLVNDCAVKSSYRLEAGDSITFEVPEPEDIHIMQVTQKYPEHLRGNLLKQVPELLQAKAMMKCWSLPEYRCLTKKSVKPQRQYPGRILR